jgi:hypothetical protein
MATKAPARKRTATKPAPAKRPSRKTPEEALHRIREGEELVTHLSKMDLPYSYGGGRSGGHIVAPVDGKPWTDCSGGAIYIAVNGYGIELRNEAGSTWSLAEEGHPGESRYLTFYIKNNVAGHDEHIIVRARKRPRPWHFGRPRYRYWEIGGSDNPKADGGPSWFIPGLKMGLTWKSRVAQFYSHRNFDDQLGVA